MGLISNIRGMLGMTGPAGANGVVGLFVATFSKPNWTIAKSTPSISFDTATNMLTFLVAGWYQTNGASPVFQAANSTVTMAKVNFYAVGPLT